MVFESETLGKPRTPDEAFHTLRLLRGRQHQVITGVAAAMLLPGELGQTVAASRVAVARVWMRHYSDPEIAAYVARGEPFDKAGGYAIQDETFRPCERVEGCYLTVVGLPLPELCAVLAELGVDPSLRPSNVAAACGACAERGTPSVAARFARADGKMGPKALAPGPCLARTR